MKRRVVSVILALVCVAGFCLYAPAAQAVNVLRPNSPVSGGMSHSIALKQDGSVWTWGSNQQYQLGLSTGVTEASTPTQVEGLTSVISVAAGYDFSVALRFDGKVYSWGGGDNKLPREVPGLSNVVAVTAGQTDILALTESGNVWQWTAGSTPKQVTSLKNIAAISVGGTHYLALSLSGEVWAWGNNADGQLGIGTKTDQSAPVKIKGLMNVIEVTAGYSHSLAVTTDGTVFSWGSNTYGQLGDGTTTASLTPVSVKNLTGARYVSAGNETSMALTVDGRLFTWGYGEYGQLAQENAPISQPTPRSVDTSNTPVFIASGVYHNFYSSAKGELYAWGRNRNRQLGTKQEGNANKPVRVLTTLAPSDNYTVNCWSQASEWAVPELKALYSMDLVLPAFWDRYKENATRAEFASLLVNVYEQINKTTVSYPSTTNFTDIQNSVWEISIRKAYELKLVDGVSATRFNPNGAITRQEAAKMICSFVAKMQRTTIPTQIVSLAYYDDAYLIASWAIPYVGYAYDNDIMKGTGRRFNPLGNLTREQMLAMICRTVIKYEWK